jgi:hypothetical protein|tara:strand:- start:3056 stop:3370 length:315 start_codon:yes stop_codon:yes gene_type:complete
MPKSYDNLVKEIEFEFEPEDYNNYDDLISAIEQEYGSVVQYLNLTIDEEDKNFQDNQEIEEEEEEIDDNSSNDREITTSDISSSNETTSGISKAVRGFLGRFRL